MFKLRISKTLEFLGKMLTSFLKAKIEHQNGEAPKGILLSSISSTVKNSNTILTSAWHLEVVKQKMLDLERLSWLTH